MSIFFYVMEFLVFQKQIQNKNLSKTHLKIPNEKKKRKDEALDSIAQTGSAHLHFMAFQQGIETGNWGSAIEISLLK